MVSPPSSGSTRLVNCPSALYVETHGVPAGEEACPELVRQVMYVADTDALVHYLVLRQRKDGHWQQENYRPPDEASDFQFTALAVRGLQIYAPKGRSREIAGRIDQARRWLQSAAPTDTTDRVFQLLGLGWAKAEPESITKAVTNLAGEQREDGGWAQLPTLASDAYATGLALFALHEAGGVAVDHRAYQRGVEFLLRTQLADGSWFVASRSFPIVEYSKSGFPHGRSQFISASATCWATMALTWTTPTSPHVQSSASNPSNPEEVGSQPTD